VLDDALERGVRLLQGREGFVEPIANVVVCLVEQVLPAGPIWTKNDSV